MSSHSDRKAPSLAGVQGTRSFDDSDSHDGNPSSRQARSYSLDDDLIDEHAQQPGSPMRSSSAAYPPEADQELLLAKEMAMAIAQNPKLTALEIKELMEQKKLGQSQPPRSPHVKSSSKSVLLKQISKGVKSSGKSMSHIIPGSVKKAFTSDKKSDKKSSAPPSPSKATSSLPPTSTTTAPAMPPRAQSSRDYRLSNTNRSSSGVNTERTSAMSNTSGGTGVQLGDFLDGSRTSNRNAEDDMDAATQGISSLPPSGASPSGPSVRIIGIVWKRRSGLGKYSTSAAWERRRIVLKGSRLYYYRTNVDAKDEESSTASGEDSDAEEPSQHKSKSWLEQVAGTKSSITTKSSSSKSSARGYLDLVKENANIGASYGHSGSPTPFALSIKVLTQTKWKLCFDTHAELMHWLTAMTDVVVQGSVDSYNSQILAAHDPSGGDGMYQGQMREPPLIANSGTQLGGHRLWVSGHYKVQSENYPDNQLDDVSEGELEDVPSDDDEPTGTTSRLLPPINSDPDLVLELDGGRDVWSIPDKQLWQWALVWNLALILSRATSLTPGRFWFILVFTNLALFGLMTKETVGGSIKNSAVVSKKMARRLSSGMSIPVATSSNRPTKTSEAVTNNHNDAIDVTNKATTGGDDDYRPVAGSTTMRIKNTTDLPVNKEGHVFAGWRYAEHTKLKVRSHNYKTDKIKVPSPGELYKCAAVDIVESKARYPDLASRVTLPKIDFDDSGPKTWNAPNVFVITIAIPTDAPKLYSSTENGGGYTLAFYFTMREETRDMLRRVTADGYDPSKETYPDGINKSMLNAVRLLEEWCRRAPTDDAFCARFKVLPNAQNLKEIGLPTWIAKYNGKPFLIKRPGQTGFLYRHPERSCFEFDISLHPFPYIAKQGINFMKDTYFKKILCTFGFLIEGRAEDELPECLIGLLQLCYPDPVHAIQGDDFMAGTSPKGFE